jgi:hypothetical protein
VDLDGAGILVADDGHLPRHGNTQR